METVVPVNYEGIKNFCEKWKVQELHLFGSILRDDFRPDSDVDVLVKLTDYSGIGLYEWMGMIEELEQIFGRKVDLVDIDSIKNPFRRKQILGNRKVIYEQIQG